MNINNIRTKNTSFELNLNTLEMRLIFKSHSPGKISPTHFEDYTSLNNPHESHSVWVDTAHPIFIDSDLNSVCFIDKDLFLGNCAATYFTTDIKLVLLNITKLAHSTLRNRT
jgi:hypothetical protein